MTREQVEKEMAQYRTIFPVVRLLGAAQVGGDAPVGDHCKCYAFWDKHMPCQNCISEQVLCDHRQRTKLEYMGRDIFQVTAVYRTDRRLQPPLFRGRGKKQDRARRCGGARPRRF